MKLNEEKVFVDITEGNTLWTDLITSAYQTFSNSSTDVLAVVPVLANAIDRYAGYVSKPGPDSKKLLGRAISRAKNCLNAIQNMLMLPDDNADSEDDNYKQYTNTQNTKLLNELDAMIDLYFIEDYAFNGRKKHVSMPTREIQVPDMDLVVAHINKCAFPKASQCDNVSAACVEKAVMKCIYLRVADRLWNYSHADASKYYDLALKLDVTSTTNNYWSETTRGILQFTLNNRMFSVTRGHDPKRMHVEQKPEGISDNVINGLPDTSEVLNMLINAYCSAMVNYIQTSPGYKEDN